MGKRLFIISICILHIAGCGDRARSTAEHRTDLTTSNTPNRVSAPQDVPPQQVNEESKAAPLIIKPERFMKLEPYQMPEILRERLEKVDPDLVPKSSKEFQIFNQHLKISARESTMTFTGVLRIAGKADEEFELSCSFDKAQPTWACSDMVPTNEDIAKTRRLQASVECRDLYRCNDTSLTLAVVIGDKTHKQDFQAEKFRVRQSFSGDGEDEGEEENIPEIPPENSSPMEKEKPEIESIPRIPGEGEGKRPTVLEKPTPSTAKLTNRVDEEDREPAPRKPAPKSTEKAPKDQPSEEGITEAVPSVDSEDEDGEEEEGEDDAPLSDEQLRALLDDPNSVIEYTPYISPPPFSAGKYTIPGIEKLHPRMDTGVPEQAIGRHNRGHLERAAKMPDRGDGFQCRADRPERRFGTNLMIELLQGATAKIWKNYPNRYPIIISDIAKRTGGRLAKHKSHQTGLDADVAFPSSKQEKGLWTACVTFKKTVTVRGKVRTVTPCRPGGGAVSEFDKERFWQFSQQLTCAEKDPVIALFVDTEIKRHMCRWARQQGFDLTNPSSCSYRTLRAMKHQPGHNNHVHVRLKCPGNRLCRIKDVSLGNGTGC